MSILPKYQSKYASVGGIAAATNKIPNAGKGKKFNNDDGVVNHEDALEEAEGFYNINDFMHP